MPWDAVELLSFSPAPTGHPPGDGDVCGNPFLLEAAQVQCNLHIRIKIVALNLLQDKKGINMLPVVPTLKL